MRATIAATTVALCVVVLAGPAVAVPIVTEHVIIGPGEYTPNTDITGQSGGFGFSGPWGDTGVNTFESVTTGLTAAELGTGGSIRDQSTTNNSWMFRLIAPHTTSSTYYFRSMVQPDYAASEGGSIRSFDSLRTTGSGFSWGPWFGNVVVRTESGGLTEYQIAAGDWAAGQTLLFFGKVEVDAVGSNERITFLLDPTDRSSEAQAVATAAASLVITDQDIMGVTDTFDRLSHNNVGAQGHEVYMDEYSLGTTWNDVIPEPSTYALLLMGIVFLLPMLRRRG